MTGPPTHHPPPGSDSGWTHPATGHADSLPPKVRACLADPSRRIGDYVVISELGRGGMGVVYRAYDLRVNRHVAIKMILNAAQLDAEDLARFQREAQVAARLRHPGIVSLYEVGTHNGQPFLVMEYVEGESFDDLLKRDRIGPRQTATIIAEVASALQHAHDQAVIHRDIKPANVLLDGSGRAHITDFGLAKDTSAQAQLTQTGQIMGTPAYMAPEQAGAERFGQGPHTDVYALGAMAYRALCGRPPFQGATQVSLLKQILFDEPAAPKTIDPAIHIDIETITLRCLEKEPKRRYPSAQEVADELERFLAGNAINARPLTKLQKLQRWTLRNRLLAAASAAIILLTTGTAVAGPLLYQRALRQRHEAAITLAKQDAREALKALETPRDSSGDEHIATGLATLESVRRWHGLVPDNQRAAVVAASRRAIRHLSRTALEEQAWSVAVHAWTQGKHLGLGEEEIRSGLEAVEAARNREVRERREEVQGWLDMALRGDLALHTAYQDALFALVRFRDPETVGQLARALDGVTTRLQEASRALYMQAATPSLDEVRAGLTTLEGLGDAIDRWQGQRPGERLDDATSFLLREARLRVVARRRREVAAMGHQISWIEILVATLSQSAGPAALRSAKLCCEALHRIGVARGAEESLAAYLLAQWDQARASQAMEALLATGAPNSGPLLLVARERFGANSPLWHRAARLLRAQGSTPPMPGGSATALIGRSLIKRGGDDLDGAMADLDQAVSIAPGDSRTWLERGIARRFTDDWHGALADLTRAIEINPRSARAFSNRGAALRSLGRDDEAGADYDQALSLDPNSLSALLFRGNLLRERKEWAAANADYSSAIAQHPHYAFGWSSRAGIRAALEQYSSALADIDRALSLDPDYPQFWFLRGEIQLLSGNLEAAHRDLSRAIELDPRHWSYFWRRGDARRMQRDLPAALEDYDTALRLNPDSGDTHLERAFVLHDMARFPEALDSAERALDLSPDQPRRWEIRGQIRQALGNTEGARADYDKAVSLAPRSSNSWTNRALLRLGANDYEGALADLTQALSLSPNDPSALRHRAHLLNLLDRHEEAAIDAQRAFELEPDRLEPLIVLSEALSLIGKKEGALEAVNQALSIDPENLDALLKRGKFLAELGRPEEALSDFDRAVALAPRSQRAWLDRGRTKLNIGHMAEARDDLDRLLEIDPDHAEGRFLRGRVRYKLNDPPGALEDLERARDLGWKLERTLGYVEGLYRKLNRPDRQLETLVDMVASKPDDASIRIQYAVALAQSARYAEAIAELDRAVELDPSNYLGWYNRGAARSELQHFDLAAADLTRALELRPDHWMSLKQRALTHVGRGNLDAGIADFDRAIELKPGRSDLWRERGDLRAVLGDYRGCIDDVSKAIQLNPLDAQSLTNRGTAYATIADLPRAQADFTKVLDLQPTNAHVAFLRGCTWLDQGVLHRAQADFTRALENEPNHAEAALRRGLTRAMLKQLPEALEDFNLAIESNRGLAEAWLNRAKCRGKLGDSAGGEADFEEFLRLSPDHPQASAVRAFLQKLRHNR